MKHAELAALRRPHWRLYGLAYDAWLPYKPKDGATVEVISSSGAVHKAVVAFVRGIRDNGYVCAVAPRHEPRLQRLWRRALNTCKIPGCLNKADRSGYCEHCGHDPVD